LPEPVHEALREAAFKERVKIHDIVLEGIGAALKRRGYLSVEEWVWGRSGNLWGQRSSPAWLHAEPIGKWHGRATSANSMPPPRKKLPCSHPCRCR